MNRLTRECLILPKAERIRLINILKESLDEREETGSRFDVLYKAATAVCGEGILTAARDFPLVMGRRLIAYQMRQEGYSLCAIGKKLAKHHASVHHMTKMMEDVINYKFNEIRYWNAFQEKLKEYDIHTGSAEDTSDL